MKRYKKQCRNAIKENQSENILNVGDFVKCIASISVEIS